MSDKRIARLSVALTLLGLISLSPAHAANQAERVVEKRYLTPAAIIGTGDPAVLYYCSYNRNIDGGRGCVVFQSEGTDRFIHIEVVDAKGLPVPAYLSQSEDPEEWEPFCGTTKKALTLTSSTPEVWLAPYRTAGVLTCPGSATTGIVKATFYKSRPPKS